MFTNATRSSVSTETVHNADVPTYSLRVYNLTYVQCTTHVH